MPHVAIIGAGVIGVMSAYSLLQSGCTITLIDPAEPGSTRASSYGNGGWLSSSLVLPGAMPGLWKQVPKFLLDPKGPLTIDKWRLPRLTPWLLSFLWNGSTESRVRSTAVALSSMVGSCPNLHQEVARHIGAPHLVEASGLLYLYRSREAYSREVLPWALRREMGATWTEFDEQELRLREPNAPEGYRFGVLVDGGHALDPGLFVAEVAKFLFANGVRYLKANALDFVFEGGRLAAVKTDHGQVECDKVVISAGAWSAKLAALVGDRIPLEAERGHHIIISGEGPDLRHPLLLTDRKITVRRVVGGTKSTGQVDFSGLDAPADALRFKILHELVTEAFPVLGEGPERHVSKWMGRRPSLPDGKPAIGRSRRSADVVHAFGHGHMGFASAPETARLVTSLICDASEEEKTAFSPRRFA
ncbi:FAD-binding oxidoreductase [Mesorhizobium sp. VK23B]|uniref:FAD-binding oxidoreductase n=1 Tax=Mesorhizobium dulcispinae TaxID=3072316 RepID=A0ABU4XP71_9HYPH|nr:MULTISPECIES: FAD-binding oxidoreductase [unclassified Mesorhizobium]MDX8470179.1 FAD-binding oxidoreductase [Mesorhizobium sp. VK23B]MDX8476545.1 FAD-binding oxidoreductase [Mesorhizobium sp. VK23A]